MISGMMRRLASTPIGASVMRMIESSLFGGDVRERLLNRMLLALGDSKFRRQWIWSAGHEPHFSDHRVTWFRAGFGAGPGDITAFIRGYYVLELVGPQDVLLDIGCGDGFFTRRFYSPRCKLVDAVDVDETAIQTAKRWHTADNVRYHLMDAVENRFPSDRYQVIVWDGAIGHFPPQTIDRMLGKISSALSPDGVFCGSESLGREGHDHLQFFDTVDDLRCLLQSFFRYVYVKEMEYFIGTRQRYLRREAYWRCALSSERLDMAAWSPGGRESA
jgi:SAM-dependent methyltransferase